jgi:hypothetical protein
MGHEETFGKTPYCTWSGDGPFSLTTGGGFHLPVSVSDLGA